MGKGSNLLIRISITILLAFNYRFCNGENVENIKIGATRLFIIIKMKNYL